jgi:small-conductance mechanosensitive channel
MTDLGVPNGFLDVISLAGIIIFSITSFSAVLSSVFVKKDNLLYLGTQVILLSIFLRMGTRWTYTAWFSGLFDSIDQQKEIFATLLLLAIAYTLDMGLKVIVWEGNLARRDQRPVPPLLIASARVIIYLFAALIILQFVFDKSITALAALSGALAVILGLSAQATLGEIFAGIALALSRPFRIGDWVKIGNHEEGRVTGMNWRMVMVETQDLIVLCIPNRFAADQTVHNFSYPNRAIRITEAIWFSQSEDPAVIQELLVGAIADTAGILADPPPSALFRGAKEGVAEYGIRFYIDDYEYKDDAVEDVWKSVTDHIARSNFVISFPRRHLAVHSNSPLLPGGVAAAETAAAGTLPGRAVSER